MGVEVKKERAEKSNAGEKLEEVTADEGNASKEAKAQVAEDAYEMAGSQLKAETGEVQAEEEVKPEEEAKEKREKEQTKDETTQEQEAEEDRRREEKTIRQGTEKISQEDRATAVGKKGLAKTEEGTVKHVVTTDEETHSEAGATKEETSKEAKPEKMMETRPGKEMEQNVRHDAEDGGGRPG